MIAETTEEAILENQIMYVPPPARWTSERVALIGDAAHGLPPHIPAGGTLGIEDVGVLRASLTDEPDTAKALARYEAARAARLEEVRAHADAVERAADGEEFAERYAAFSHWMITTAPAACAGPGRFQQGRCMTMRSHA
ncbi:FAD-dependent monooxygenase [Streptomyces sp. NPDC007901]|uniref:FAD-dependent monooxygenase n=1 Tax=Streptomyces sp. NPDC007901 TaxID=3364785 RepID=UPI0036E6C131